MKIERLLFFIALVLIFSTSINAQTPVTKWFKQMGGIGTDAGFQIATDTLGNIYSVGYFSDTVDFDPGSGINNLYSKGDKDFFIQKLDTNGNLLWVKSFGGQGEDKAFSIALNNNGDVFVVGIFEDSVNFSTSGSTSNILSSNGGSDIFILKIDSNGNSIWTKQIGGIGQDKGNSLNIDSYGNLIITGYFSNTVDFDPHITGINNLTSTFNEDVFLLKLNSNGLFQWVKQISCTNNANGISVTTISNNDIFITGNFEDTISAGYTDLVSAGYSDIFIAKYWSDGSFVWAKQLGSWHFVDEKVRSIASDMNGNVYLTGKFAMCDFDPGPGTFNLTSSGGIATFILKLSPTGAFQWAKKFDGPGGCDGMSIYIDESSSVYTTGRFFNTVDFDPSNANTSLTSEHEYDAFIHKLNTQGNFMWVKQIKGTLSEIGYEIRTDQNGDVITIGCYNATVNSESDSTYFMSSNGDYDIYIHKMKNCWDTYSTLNIMECDSFTWIDGNTYYASQNNVTHILPNSSGCDSIATLNLTIVPSSSLTDTIIACDSYTWRDGITYTSSNNTATFILSNQYSCDSTIHLNLSINNSDIITDVITACNSYTWIDGITYSSSNNTATYTLINSSGCDSVINLDLTINSVTDLSLFLNGITLLANNPNATYQWLDCDNNYSPINGATNQSYTAVANGNYAVEISQNGCIDTSICILVSSVGIIQNSFSEQIKVYPNPTDGQIIIELGNNHKTLSARLYSTLGQELIKKSAHNTNTIILDVKNPKGLYLLEISDYTGKKAVIRIVKE